MAESLLNRSQQILDKLEATFQSEGLEFELIGVEGETLNLRGRRVAPGVPAAFMVRAISGTFRRYLPDIQDVCLLEYDPGPEGMKTTQSSPDFERVLRHAPPTAHLALKGIPALELHGLDRRQSVRALEAFVKLWKDKVPYVRVYGREEDAPRRAVEKWANFNEKRLEADAPDRWTVYIREDIADPGLNEEERMPGRVFLINDE